MPSLHNRPHPAHTNTRKRAWSACAHTSNFFPCVASFSDDQMYKMFRIMLWTNTKPKKKNIDYSQVSVAVLIDNFISATAEMDQVCLCARGERKKWDIKKDVRDKSNVSPCPMLLWFPPFSVLTPPPPPPPSKKKSLPMNLISAHLPLVV